MLVSTVTSSADFVDLYGYLSHVISRRVPPVLRGSFGVVAWLANHWEAGFRAVLETEVSGPDRELFAERAGDVLVADATEAFRQGGRGPGHEFALLGQSWGVDLAAIEASLSLWHGSADGLSMSGSFDPLSVRSRTRV